MTSPVTTTPEPTEQSISDFFDVTSNVTLRPSYEGGNISTTIGFKCVHYLIEAAVLEHFRAAGLGATNLYVEHGVGLPHAVARVGLDLEPVDLADDDAVRWLEACLWPDVPGRVERFRAARSLLRDDAQTLVAGDMVDDLPAALARAVAGPGLRLL